MSNYALCKSGQQAVTASAVALATLQAPNPLGSGLPTGEGIDVTVSALKANTASVFIGGAGVTDATGYELPPGISVKLRVNDTSEIYVIAAATGSTVTWIANNI